MMKFVLRSILVLLVILLHVNAFADELWDDFSGTTLDSSKWSHLDLVREVSGGQLVSKFKNNTNYFENNQTVTLLASFSPAGVSDVKADITVVSVTQGGGTNPFVGAALFTSFFNTNAAAIDYEGEVMASIALGDNDGDSSLEAWWSIYECQSADPATGLCTNWGPPQAGGEIVVNNGITAGEQYTALIEYDGSNGFDFTVTKVGTPADTGTAIDKTWSTWGKHSNFYVVSLNTFAGNRTGDADQTGYVSALFDNVAYWYLGASAFETFDDFSTSPLAYDNKWFAPETVREIRDSKLRLAIQGDGDSQESRINFNSSGIKPETEATVTILSDSVITPVDGDTVKVGRVQINGDFYNDTYDVGSYNGEEGNVYAMLRLHLDDDGGTGAYCYVDRADVAAPDDDGDYTTLFETNFAMPIVLDRPYECLIIFTGTEIVFIVEDTVSNAEETQVYTLPQGTNTYAPNPGQSRAIRARVKGGNGGYFHAEVDDVFVDELSGGGMSPAVPLLLLD